MFQVQPTYNHIGNIFNNCINSIQVYDYYQVSSNMADDPPAVPTVPLAAPFTFSMIMFQFLPHPRAELCNFHNVMNSAYEMSLYFEGDELNGLLFADPADKTAIKANAFQVMKEELVEKIHGVAVQVYPELTVQEVRRWFNEMTIIAPSNTLPDGVRLRHSTALAKQFDEYVRLLADDNLPDEFIAHSGIVLKIDMSQVFPDLREEFNGKNWDKFNGTFIAAPPSRTSTATAAASAPAGSNSGGAPSGPVAQDTYEQALARAVRLSTPFQADVLNLKDFPEDVEIRYNLRNHSTTILCKRDIPPFMNELTRNRSKDIKPNKFVRYPKHYNSHIIYCDGSMFKYLKHQLSKVRSQFVKTFPKLDDWNAKEWYRFHLELEAKASEHHLWVMPYYLQSPKCKEARGFVIADPDDDKDADLHSDYLECIGPWNAQLTDGFKSEGVLPNATAKSIFKQCGGDAFQFLRRGNLLFNPLLRPSDLSFVRTHPTQGSMSFNDYFDDVQFYYRMQGLVMDVATDFKAIPTQRLFIANMRHASLIAKDYESERFSNDPSVKEKYEVGRLVSTLDELCTHYDSITRRSAPSSSSSSLSSRTIKGNFKPRSSPRFSSTAKSKSFAKTNHVDLYDDWEHVPLHHLDEDSSPDWDNEEELFYYAVHGVDTSSADQSDIDFLKYVINRITVDKQF